MAALGQKQPFSPSLAQRQLSGVKQPPPEPDFVRPGTNVHSHSKRTIRLTETIQFQGLLTANSGRQMQLFCLDRRMAFMPLSGLLVRMPDFAQARLRQTRPQELKRIRDSVL